MGTYLNPGNSGFAEILQSDYVDKTGLISLINSTIGTKKKLTCISRPRRFGKSYAAQMLCAYYDKTCDSHGLFEKYEIAKDESYEKNINKYHVINLDISGFISDAKKKEQPIRNIPSTIDAAVLEEIRAVCPEVKEKKELNAALLEFVRITKTKIVFIIDEWDSLIREAKDDIARLIAGDSIVVDPDSFQNDVETFTSKDDVLTLLIHLGYLTYEEISDSYDEEDEQLTGLARIPNEEVRSEFEKILRKAKHKELIRLVRKSDQLLQDTIGGNEEAVVLDFTPGKISDL